MTRQAAALLRSATAGRSFGGGILGAVLFTALIFAPAKARAEELPRPVRAVSANTFLNSLGVNTHVDQGYNPQSYIGPLRFLGVREVRDAERHVDGEVAIARATGVRFVINGGGDLKGLLTSARVLAQAGALLAVEGPNEPNNFPMTYDGQQGGGAGHSWYAVAAFQSALYRAMKHDPLLSRYPVFGPSETGAETDDVGVQFRVIPPGATTTFRPGTRFSDYANIHNYVSGVRGGYGNNQAWDAASPTLNGRWDGLYGNVGLTWFRHYQGYPTAVLPNLPRVTTETGWDSVSDPGGEAVQGAVLTDTYLAQFKRGWRYTFIYELRDGEGGPGHQGLYSGDRPKLAAIYIHNLTTVLADRPGLSSPRSLRYVIRNKPPTVHDLLLEKKTGVFDLVVWDERATGSDHVTVTFAWPQDRVGIIDITKGSSPSQLLRHVRIVELSLTDHAVVLKLSR